MRCECACHYSHQNEEREDEVSVDDGATARERRTMLVALWSRFTRSE
jgi:hypothetical protein